MFLSMLQLRLKFTKMFSAIDPNVTLTKTFFVLTQHSSMAREEETMPKWKTDLPNAENRPFRLTWRTPPASSWSYQCSASIGWHLPWLWRGKPRTRQIATEAKSHTQRERMANASQHQLILCSDKRSSWHDKNEWFTHLDRNAFPCASPYHAIMTNLKCFHKLKRV